MEEKQKQKEKQKKKGKEKKRSRFSVTTIDQDDQSIQETADYIVVLWSKVFCILIVFNLRGEAPTFS